MNKLNDFRGDIAQAVKTLQIAIISDLDQRLILSIL